jgi:DNA-binding transcriptional regulator YhcF (GntR family)
MVSRRLVTLLRERIMSGRLPAGARLPDVADMSREFGLAPRTVQSAIAVLCADELLEVRPGEGVYVREIEHPTVITMGPGDTVASRMPSPRESTALGISEQMPVLVLVRSGGEIECYPGGNLTKVASAS